MILSLGLCVLVYPYTARETLQDPITTVTTTATTNIEIYNKQTLKITFLEVTGISGSNEKELAC